MKYLLSLSSAFLMTCALAGTQVAKVNNTIITSEQLDQAFKQSQMYGAEMATKEKILGDLINRELSIQKAYSQKLEQNQLVKEKMEDVLFHAYISKELEGEFAKIKVSDKDVEQFYKKFPEYRTAHILLRVPAVPEEKRVKEAEKLANELSAELKKDPSKFPALANKYSQTSVAPDGGDIGYQVAMSLAKPYFSAINGKPLNFITTPVRTPFGFHIIKVLGVKKFQDINKDVYKKIIYDQRRDELIAKFFESMHKGAKIEINKQALQ